MNKKILAVTIAAILVVSSVGAFYAFGGGKLVNRLFSDVSYVSDFDGGYMGVVDAKTVSICTVEDSKNGILPSYVGNSGAAVMPTGGNVFSDADYDGYHNELHKTDKNGDEGMVFFYSNESDMNKNSGKKDLENGNVIYLERCGSFYFMVYHIGSLAGIYNMMAHDNMDFWHNDTSKKFYMVDANTGKVFNLTGLWCGTTAWRYSGSNDVTPSIQYMGYYEGEEYFKVNVECNKYNARPVDGEFRNIEGVVAFKSDGENLTYRLVMVDDDAIIKTYIGPGEGENYFQQIEGKYRTYGYDMELYKNGLIRYVLNDTPVLNGGRYWPGSDTGETYIRTVDGRSINVEGQWEECSNYICRNVDYDNTYFPVSMDRYESDGSIKTIVLSEAESYSLASTNHYTGCVHREVTDTSTFIYTLNLDGTVDRLELKKTLEYVLTENIFGQTIPIKERAFDHAPISESDFYVHNNEVFYGMINWSYSRLSENTGIMIIDSSLYAMMGDVMKEYDLKTGEMKEYDIPADSVIKLRVDGNGHLYAEGYESETMCKLDLGDGGFQVSRTSYQVMTLKKVLGNEDSGNVDKG